MESFSSISLMSLLTKCNLVDCTLLYPSFKTPSSWPVYVYFLVKIKFIEFPRIRYHSPLPMENLHRIFLLKVFIVFRWSPIFPSNLCYQQVLLLIADSSDPSFIILTQKSVKLSTITNCYLFKWKRSRFSWLYKKTGNYENNCYVPL